jgi:predicted nucleic acid-binding protein
MRVLVDASVWSLSLRRKRSAVLSGEEMLLVASLTEAIRDGRVAVIGPIRQELLSGIKDSAQFEKTRSALAVFQDEPLTTFHFEEAARLYNLCRSRGVECGPTDILICAVAVHAHWTVLANDAGMKRCIEVMRGVGLMQ